MERRVGAYVRVGQMAPASQPSSQNLQAKPCFLARAHIPTRETHQKRPLETHTRQNTTAACVGEARDSSLFCLAVRSIPVGAESDCGDVSYPGLRIHPSSLCCVFSLFSLPFRCASSRDCSALCVGVVCTLISRSIQSSLNNLVVGGTVSPVTVVMQKNQTLCVVRPSIGTAQAHREPVLCS